MNFTCGIVNFSGAPVETGVLTSSRTILADDGAAGFSSGGSAAVRGMNPSLLLATDARLDNREELRGLLSPGTAPPSDGDLMALAYEKWGKDWHGHLRGAYAAAVWDPRTRELLLLRDRSGERGLYWCRTPGGVLFGSEPAQLVASRKIAGTPSLPRLLAYLLDAPAAPTWSYFEHVHRVPEGHQVRLTEHQTELDSYWDWRTVEAEPWGRRSAAPELADRLRTAVERRLAVTCEMTGEVGVLLSGGLDSSSVAAAAAGALERQGRRLHAFTWTSRSGDAIDETAVSRNLIQSRPNIVEHPVEADALWPLSRYPEAYADPSDPETNTLPDLLVTTLESARRLGVGVLLNGIGGDPVIGQLAPELALLARGRLDALWRRWRRSGIRRAGLLRELRFLTRQPHWPDWLTPSARKLAVEAGLDRPPASWSTLASRDRFRRALLASPANAAALERFDRLSRRFQVRIEAPWHDPDLAALVLALHDRALAALPPAKRLLRAAMADHLPAAVLHVPTDKTGRSDLWARGLLVGGREAVERLLRGSRLAELGLIDGARLLAAYEEDASRRQVTPKLWEVLTVEAWLLTIS